MENNIKQAKKDLREEAFFAYCRLRNHGICELTEEKIDSVHHELMKLALIVKTTNTSKKYSKLAAVLFEAYYCETPDANIIESHLETLMHC